tara:strand:+ start:44 stop:487 length:444 start_codon:yes stop_codon:yes gene_type:complete
VADWEIIKELIKREGVKLSKEELDNLKLSSTITNEFANLVQKQFEKTINDCDKNRIKREIIVSDFLEILYNSQKIKDLVIKYYPGPESPTDEELNLINREMWKNNGWDDEVLFRLGICILGWNLSKKENDEGYIKSDIPEKYLRAPE